MDLERLVQMPALRITHFDLSAGKYSFHRFDTGARHRRGS